MVERIERIARVKAVDYDVGRRDNHSRRDEKNGSFLNELRRVLHKKNKPGTIPEAYNLELSGETSSLFYYGSLDLDALLR